jgi:hypothetical protein
VAPGPVWTGGKSRPHRDSIPGPSSPYLVAIPTELSGPPLNCGRFSIMKPCVSFMVWVYPYITGRLVVMYRIGGFVMVMVTLVKLSNPVIKN